GVHRLRKIRAQPDRLKDVPGAARDYFDVVVLVSLLTQIGWTNAPVPAESHTAKRTHALPAGSNGIANFFAPNAPVSVAGTIWRSIFFPSPHTTSTNDNGKVHSTSAVRVCLAPAPS